MKRSFLKAIESLINRGVVSSHDRADVAEKDRELLDITEKVVKARHEAKPYRAEFKDELFQKIMRQAGALREKRVKRRKHLFRFVHTKAWATVGVMVVAIAFVVAVSQRGPSGLLPVTPGQLGGILVPVAHAQDNFEVQPETVDNFGVIRQDSNFVVTSQVEISRKDLQQYVRINGGADFSVFTVDGGHKFLVDPQNDFMPGDVVRVAIATISGEEGQVPQPYTYEWAFEVSDHFKILSTVPDTQTTGISTDTPVRFTLSHTNTVDPAGFVEVLPEHPVRVETGYKTVSVVPTQPWEKDVVYTVTLKRGFGVDQSLVPDGADLADWRLQEDIVVEFTTATSDPNIESLSFEETYFQTVPGDAIRLRGWTYSIPATRATNVEVYRVAPQDAQPMIVGLHQIPRWLPNHLQQNRLQDLVEPLEKLEPVQRYTLNDVSYARGVEINLQPIAEEGVYFVKLSIGGVDEYIVWNVTTLGAHVSASETRGFVWAVDVRNNVPVPSARVSTSTGAIGTTNDEGVAVFGPDATTTLETQEVFFVTDGARLVALPVYNWGRNIEVRPIFNGFMFADQNIVHIDDTVRFWGLVRQQDAEIREAEVALLGSGHGTGAFTAHLGRVSIEEDGFFQGDLTLRNLKPGFYSLALRVGGHEFSRVFLEVRDYVAPELQISATPARERIYAGESNIITIQTTFFDGQPAPFVDLNVIGSEKASMTTDENGMAALEVESTKTDCLTSRYLCQTVNYEYLDIVPAESTTGESLGRAAWTVVNDYHDIEIDTRENGQTMHVDGRATRRTYTNEEPYPTPDDWESHVVAGRWEAEVYAITSQRSGLGTTFDSYYNKTRYFYDFHRAEHVLATFSGDVDGDGRFAFDFPLQPNTNYRIVTRFIEPDGVGDRAEEYVYLYNIPFGRYYVNSPEQAPDITKATDYDSFRELRVQVDDRLLAIGDDVQMKAVLSGNTEIQLPDNTLSFFFTANTNIQDYYVRAHPSAVFRLEEKHLPSVTIFAAVVYQGHIFFTEYETTTITVDPEPYKLQVHVRPQSDAYAIGDRVNAQVEVLDANGDPVKARVNVRVLDAAYLSLDTYAAEQDPLDQFWSGNYNRVYINDATHQARYGTDGRGGGGGDGRQDFQELAYYTVVETGRDGKADISFTLPDNLTTWNILASAATPDYQGGFGDAPIYVTQPLRVVVDQSESYLVGDDAVITAEGYGEFLGEDDQIDFSFYGPIVHQRGKEYKLEDFPVAAQTAKATRSEPVNFDLPELAPGRYAFAVRANAKDRQDLVIKTFQILEARSTVRKAQTFDVQQAWTAPAVDAASRIDVAFASRIGAKAYAALNNWCDCGGRLDHLVARQKSESLLKQYFGEPETYENEIIVGPEYRPDEGGYALFPFGSSDLEATSLAMTAIDPDTIAPLELAAYFNGVLNPEATTEEVAQALRGLAALEQPGLNALKGFAGRDDLSVKSKLVAIDALLLYGDKQTARAVWAGLQDEVQVKEGLAWIGKEDRAESKELTELALINDLRLGGTNHEAYYEYLLTFDEPINPIVEVRYWEERLRNQPLDEMSFVVRLGEQEQFVTLKGFQSFSLNLDQSQLAQLEVHDARGPLAASIGYDVPGQDEGESDVVSVTRQYRQDGRAVEEIDPSRPVEVRITVRATDRKFYGNYLVEDFVPSGLAARVQGRGFGYEVQRCTIVPYAGGGHKVVSNLYLHENCPAMTIVYSARPLANGGSYIAEGARVTSVDHADVRVVTESQVIQIVSK